MIHLVCPKCYDLYIFNKQVYHQECLTKFNIAGVYDVTIKDTQDIGQVTPRRLEVTRWQFSRVFFRNGELCIIQDAKVIELKDILPKDEIFTFLIEVDR